LSAELKAAWHYDQLWCTGKVSLPPLKCLRQETRKTCGRASRPDQDRDKGARASRKRDRPEI